LSKLVAQAREQRKRIKEIITNISGSSDQYSNSVDQLSDPTFERTLPFPFVGFEAPVQFKVVEGNWQYVGRTKFKELLQEFEEVQRSRAYSTVWLYGTQGYGKSHLLAALVCYLTAQDERVVYISDCEALVEDPVGYLRAAMLFAWADDIATQEIMTLNTLEEIDKFFSFGEKVIFIIDQMNALEIDSPGEKKKREDLSDWIGRFTYGHKKVYSTSTNNTNYREQDQYTNWRILPVYGGLTEVSRCKIMS
jgi:Bacterial dnaA  protein